jgi:hypothetical protein
MRTIFAGPFAQTLPPGATTRQVPAPGQHVEVTHRRPTPHSAELVQTGPQFWETSLIHTFMPSMVWSQIQPPFEASQGTPNEQPRAEGVLQVGA